MKQPATEQLQFTSEATSWGFLGGWETAGCRRRGGGGGGGKQEEERRNSSSRDAREGEGKEEMG